MNYCETYNLLCPYALSELGRSASLPCIATQEQCDKWRKKKRKRIEIKVHTGVITKDGHGREPYFRHH